MLDNALAVSSLSAIWFGTAYRVVVVMLVANTLPLRSKILPLSGVRGRLRSHKSLASLDSLLLDTVWR